jgi:hypothetical protein
MIPTGKGSIICTASVAGIRSGAGGPYPQRLRLHPVDELACGGRRPDVFADTVLVWTRLIAHGEGSAGYATA